MSLEIIRLKNQGFCYGVTRAITIAVKAANDNSLPRPIYLLGDIVHNKHISDYLDRIGIITIKGSNRFEMLDQVPNNTTVIFSAHGVSEKVKAKAKQKNLFIVDAICPYVEKTFNLISEEINKGNEILYIGKKNHPETEAVLELSSHAHLITEEHYQKYPDNLNYKIANQTTMSKYDIESLCSLLFKDYSHIELLDMICKVTENRQNELTNILNDPFYFNSLVIIIGDKNSNNSTKLFELASRSLNHRAVFIESISDLSLSMVKKYKQVIIASGTSTPLDLIDEVIDVLSHIDEIEKEYIESKIELTI